MLIQVTQEHIDEGIVYDCEVCPIALAINRLLKLGLKTVIVATVIICNSDRELCRCNYPDEARDFINRFDRLDPVKPFSFELDIPCVLVA